MIRHRIKNELQNILSGKNGISHDPIIQAVTRYLRTSQKASPVAETKHQNKAKETEKLIGFAQKNQLFYDRIDEEYVLKLKGYLNFFSYAELHFVSVLTND